MWPRDWSLSGPAQYVAPDPLHLAWLCTVWHLASSICSFVFDISVKNVRVQQADQPVGSARVLTEGRPPTQGVPAVGGVAGGILFQLQALQLAAAAAEARRLADQLALAVAAAAVERLVADRAVAAQQAADLRLAAARQQAVEAGRVALFGVKAAQDAALQSLAAVEAAGCPGCGARLPCRRCAGRAAAERGQKPRRCSGGRTGCGRSGARAPGRREDRA